MKPGRLFLLVFSALLTGCQFGLYPNPAARIETPEATATPQQTPGTPNLPAGTPTTTVTSASSAPVTLTVWIPPEFSPFSGTPASQILQSRLDSFSLEQPGAQVKLRIKPAEGLGGLLDALTTTFSAAPDAMPDLIALPESALEAAALKGMLTPLDGLTTVQNDPDWYGFAKQMAVLQGMTYGLAFAGDALVLSSLNTPETMILADWQAVFHAASPLAFVASDRQALLTLALYEGAGGEIVDTQRRPMLAEEPLFTALSIYQDGIKAGLFPVWLSDLETDDQVWKAFTDGKASMAVTWSSNFLRDPQPNVVISPLPAGLQKPLTLARGWLWAISSPHPERRALAARLAEYLTSASFLADWDDAAGYLPPRPSALTGWRDVNSQALFNSILSSAQALPASDVLGSLGPILLDATQRMIKDHGDPVQISKETVEHIQQP